MRGFRAVMLCSCLWIACISDLKPDVGPLAATDDDVGSAGGREGGAASGSSSGSSNGSSNGSTSGQGLPEAGASSGADGGETHADDGGQEMPGPMGCSNKDSDPKKTVSFAKQVRPILNGCRCHDPQNEDPFAILESGLTISGYETLRKGGDQTGVEIIVDRNPCASIILQKLSETPPFGDRMPRDGPYLSLAERTLISDWIVEGARDN